MNKNFHRVVGLGAVLSVAALIGASCTVDTSDLEFNDAKFKDVKNSGGNSQVSPNGQAGEESKGTGGGGSGEEEPSSCQSGERRCDGKQALFCVEDAWQDWGEPCQIGCYEGECLPEGSCTPGEMECISSKHSQKCNEQGLWIATACRGDTICLDEQGTCAGECVPHSKSCDGKNIRRCTSEGKWEVETTCDADCQDGLCTNCVAGDIACSADHLTLRTCGAEGNWESEQDQDCSAQNQACLDDTPAKCGGECVPGSKQCSGSSQVQECSPLGQWGSPSSCGQKACNNGECVGSCLPGQYRCTGVGRRRELCNSLGQWSETLAICNCVTGSQRCSSQAINHRETCSDQGTWESQECQGSGMVCRPEHTKLVLGKDSTTTEQYVVPLACVEVSKSRSCIQARENNNQVYYLDTSAAKYVWVHTPQECAPRGPSYHSCQVTGKSNPQKQDCPAFNKVCKPTGCYIK